MDLSVSNQNTLLLENPELMEKTAALAKWIMHHKRLYYAGHPEVSDIEYDRMEIQLRLLDPDHPALNFVGTEVDSLSEKASHTFPMLSLEKTYVKEDLSSWAEGRELVGSLKIDGNSLSLIYEKGQLIAAKTRGNGRVGELVTPKVMWVDDIPKKLRDRVDGEVRGELYCCESDFLRLAEAMQGLGLEKPTSPRNIVAGLLGRKNFASLCQYFSFFAFEFLDSQGSGTARKFAFEWEKLEYLQSQGFVLPRCHLIKQPDDIDAYLASVQAVASEDEIPIDGAVFTLNDLDWHERLGLTSHHPRYKMSFKWQGETAVSKLQRIDWATSRLGIVTPVAVIDPVYLSGASITNVTLHNAAHLRIYNLKSGDQIELVRSGEVIPKFLQVVQSSPGEAEIPSQCPSCHSSLIDDGVRLLCENRLVCPAQIAGGILNWIQSCEIDDLSEKRLEQMMNMGFVKSIPDLYLLTKEQLLQLPATKDKMADKLLKNIEKARSPTMVQYLCGLGIQGMGRASWEKLLETTNQLEALRSLSTETIQSIDGFAEKSAKQLVEGMLASGELIDRLATIGVRPQVYSPPIGALSGPLLGQIIVITGELSIPRKEAEAMVRQAGGRLSDSVSKKTNAVVTNEPDSQSSKMKQARKLGIKILNESELWSWIKS